MNAPIKVLTNGNKRLEIHSDDSPQSPREWDNLGTMYCFHRRYGFGDKHGLTVEQASKIEDSSDYIALPIYMYDHSGQTIKTTPFSCPWDSGKLGFIAVSKEKVRKEYNWKVITKARKALIENYLKGEVETYDTYIRGDVYGFKLFENDVQTDSCWGFFGSDNKASGLFDHAGWVE
jgi:hypothetical protein